MRYLLALLLLALLAGCTRHAAASADAAPAVPARSPPESPSEPPHPQRLLSKTTGIRLDPVASVFAQDDQALMAAISASFEAEHITCKVREDYAIKSPSRFRETDAYAGHLLSDAKEIGWELKTRKVLAGNALLFGMAWHGTVVVLLLVFEPEQLSVTFCEPPKPTPEVAPQGKHRRR